MPCRASSPWRIRWLRVSVGHTCVGLRQGVMRGGPIGRSSQDPPCSIGPAVYVCHPRLVNGYGSCCAAGIRPWFSGVGHSSVADLALDNCPSRNPARTFVPLVLLVLRMSFSCRGVSSQEPLRGCRTGESPRKSKTIPAELDLGTIRDILPSRAHSFPDSPIQGTAGSGLGRKARSFPVSRTRRQMDC